jgi:hypothetical protein
MAIVWMDGFEQYGGVNTTPFNQGVYDGEGIRFSNQVTRFSGFSVGFDYQSTLRKSILSTSTIGLGGAFYVGTPMLVNNPASFLAVWSSGDSLGVPTTPIVSVSCTEAGAITVNTIASVNDGSCSDVVAQTANGLLTKGRWHHLEARFQFGGSSFDAIVRLNGVQVLSVTNASFNITTGNIDGVGSKCYSGAGVNAYYLDDFFVWDTTGGINNTFLGDKRVVTLRPNGDTADADWTAVNSPTGYAAINDGTPNYNDYIESSTVGDLSVFDLSSISSAAQNICAIQSTTLARKTDAGTSTIRVDIETPSGTLTGPDHPLTTGYGYLTDIYNEKPGGGAWTVAEINAAQVAITRVE